MYTLLRPHLYVSSVFDIDFSRLYRRGIRGLVVDLDNTLVPWNQREVTPAVAAWFRRARAAGMALCIVSNNHDHRVQGFADSVGAARIARAGKPRRRAFFRAMAAIGTHAGSTAVIGDQVFTDILGGNRLGLYTILVKPVGKHEFWGTRLVRRLEDLVRRRLVLRSGSHQSWGEG